MYYWLILLALLLVWLWLSAQSILLRKKTNRRRKGGSPMPIELLQECIGKVCSITMMNSISGLNGKITTAKDNWMRVEVKDSVRFINCDMVQEINILPAKYQK